MDHEGTLGNSSRNDIKNVIFTPIKVDRSPHPERIRFASNEVRSNFEIIGSMRSLADKPLILF